MEQAAFVQAAKMHGDSVYRVALHASRSPSEAEAILYVVLRKLLTCRMDFADEEHRKR